MRRHSQYSTRTRLLCGVEGAACAAWDTTVSYPSLLVSHALSRGPVQIRYRAVSRSRRSRRIAGGMDGASSTLSSVPDPADCACGPRATASGGGRRSFRGKPSAETPSSAVVAGPETSVPRGVRARASARRCVNDLSSQTHNADANVLTSSQANHTTDRTHSVMISQRSEYSDRRRPTPRACRARLPACDIGSTRSGIFTTQPNRWR